MDIAEECCGFGGTFSVKFPEVSGAMARTKIDSIQKTGATTVVSIDSSCLMQLQGVIDRAGLPIRTLHLAEVLASEMNAPETEIQQAVDDPRLQLAIYTATGRLIDHRAGVVNADVLPHYQDLRNEANAIKKHTIENLDYYLEQLESNVIAHGGKVVFCRTGAEAADFVLDLAKKRGVHMLVKSKSMTSEEIHFNERLEEHDLEAVETDLGEWILQLSASAAVSHRRASAAPDALRRRRRFHQGAGR